MVLLRQQAIRNSTGQGTNSEPYSLPAMPCINALVSGLWGGSQDRGETEVITYLPISILITRMTVLGKPAEYQPHFHSSRNWCGQTHDHYAHTLALQYHPISEGHWVVATVQMASQSWRKDLGRHTLHLSLDH